MYVLDPRRQTVVRVEQGGEDWRESNAVATYSPGLRLSFTTIDGHLAVCCPGGRTVRPGDDPFGWLLDEMNRADALLNELADRDEEIAKRDETIAEQLKELEALRSQRR